MVLKLINLNLYLKIKLMLVVITNKHQGKLLKIIDDCVFFACLKQWQIFTFKTSLPGLLVTSRSSTQAIKGKRTWSCEGNIWENLVGHEYIK